MLNKAKLVAERLHVTERHARRLIAGGDDRAEAILAVLPNTEEEEFRWRLDAIIQAVKDAGNASNALWKAHCDFWGFCLDGPHDESFLISPEVVQLIGTLKDEIVKHTPKGFWPVVLAAYNLDMALEAERSPHGERATVASEYPPTEEMQERQNRNRRQRQAV